MPLSVRKMTKSDESDDKIVDMATVQKQPGGGNMLSVQNVPSNVELALEPSYSDTLS